MTTTASFDQHEVAEYLAKMSDPVRVLRLTKMSPGSDWSFRLSMAADMTPTLNISFPKSCPAGGALDLQVPEILFGNPHVDERSNALVIEGFGGNRVKPSLAQKSVIERTLREGTWMGSSSFAHSHAKISWHILAQSWTFDVSDIRANPLTIGTANLSFDGLPVRVEAVAVGSVLTLRDARFGVDVPRQVSALREFIRSRGIVAGSIELGLGWLEAAPMGLVQLTDKAASTLAPEELKCENVEALSALAAKVRKGKLEREAARLSERKAAARVAPRVYWNDRLLGAEPTSEAGTVAIIHKLEALGGIPVAKFETRAWAGADGIDAIADFRIDTVHPEQHEIAVEYEYHFSSFLAHQHPHEHVELVVCWDQQGQLSPTQFEWLWHIRTETKFIPVLTVSTFPGIKIRREHHE